MESVERYLRNNGIKPSYQRIRIMDYLLENKNHPTCDTIFRELAHEIPTLSKTTVYNTMKIFIDKKVAIPICIEDNEVRFDAYTSVHGHFKCFKCGEVFDLNIDSPIINPTGLEKFKIEETHIYYKGECVKCLVNN